MFLCVKVIDVTGLPPAKRAAPLFVVDYATEVYKEVRPSEVPKRFPDHTKPNTLKFVYVYLETCHKYFLACVMRSNESKEVLQMELPHLQGKRVSLKIPQGLTDEAAWPRCVPQNDVQAAIDAQQAKLLKSSTLVTQHRINQPRGDSRSDSSVARSHPQGPVPSNLPGAHYAMGSNWVNPATPPSPMPMPPHLTVSKDTAGFVSFPRMNNQEHLLGHSNNADILLKIGEFSNLLDTMTLKMKSFSTVVSEVQKDVCSLKNELSAVSNKLPDLKGVQDEMKKMSEVVTELKEVKTLFEEHAACGDLFEVSHIPDVNGMVDVLPNGNLVLSKLKFDSLMTGKSIHIRTLKAIAYLCEDNAVSFDVTGTTMVSNACFNILKALHKKLPVCVDGALSYFAVSSIVQERLREQKPDRKEQKKKLRQERAAKKKESSEGARGTKGLGVITKEAVNSAVLQARSDVMCNVMSTIEAAEKHLPGYSKGQSCDGETSSSTNSPFSMGGYSLGSDVEGEEEEVVYSSESSVPPFQAQCGGTVSDGTLHIVSRAQNFNIENILSGNKRSAPESLLAPPNKLRAPHTSVPTDLGGVEANFVQRLQNGLRGALQPIPDEARDDMGLPPDFTDVDCSSLMNTFSASEFGKFILTSVQAEATK